ncbi:hypothetical protein BKA70DRAFT_1418629 [Coprinopsis sp. MPI-PUGE-AT-0042]|nr:hypothetical protein BKA70DRAFT_1418629 [Coprinopsis sp. MPI-PUGE-AT-0042]
MFNSEPGPERHPQSPPVNRHCSSVFTPATPLRHRSSQSAGNGRLNAMQQRALIWEEIQGSLVTCRPEFINAVYEVDGMPTDTQIQDYVDNSKFYDTARGRWTNLPLSPTSERTIYEPMAAIFNEVLGHFRYDTAANGSRQCWTRSGSGLDHFEEPWDYRKFVPPVDGEKATLTDQAPPTPHTEAATSTTLPPMPVPSNAAAASPQAFDVASTTSIEVGATPSAKPDQYKPVFSSASSNKALAQKTFPDFIISGNGNFLPPDSQTNASKKAGKGREKTGPKNYSQVISAADAKLDSAMTNIQEHLSQLGVYGRQLFNSQSHRNFVRSATFSERRARFFHYDRSGVKYTELFNIHEKPILFIRMFLGLASPLPDLLGFDNTITWDETKQVGIIDASKLNVLEGKSVKHQCQLANHQPVFYRGDLVGRGTTCWCVLLDIESTTLLRALVKDSWMSVGRTSEHELLLAVTGLVGVGQMIAWQKLGQTCDYRGEGDRLVEGFRERCKCRIWLEKYGNAIFEFTNPKQFLCAMRDAINGHRQLFQKVGILHRDISLTNVLLGRDGDDRPGWQGVLIDLDMAIRVDRQTVEADCRTGTRMFQSCSVLSTCLGGSETADPESEDEDDDPKQEDAAKQPRHTHDYPDDLESFFYLFAYIIMAFSATGEWVKHPPIMDKWDSADPTESYWRKVGFMALDGKVASLGIDSSWKKPVKALFKSFYGLISAVASARSKRTSVANDKDSDFFYDKIATMFNKAIDSIVEEAAAVATDENNTTRTPPVTFVNAIPSYRPVTPDRPTTPRRKRSSEGEDEEDSPSSKRQRHTSSYRMPPRSSLASIPEND